MRPAMPTRSTTGVEESPVQHLGSSSAASERSRKRIRVLAISSDEASELVSRALDVEGLQLLEPVSVLEELDVSGDETPDALVLHAPDPGSDLVAQVRTVRDAVPGARIVVVAKSTSLRQLRVLMGEGVDALVLESDVARCLGLAVRSACEGLLSFPESLRGTLARPVLSSREKQVLGLVVLGLTNAEIARKLHVSQSTVKSHLSSSFAKLGARSRSEATALILDPDTGLGTGILAISEER